ncbi:YwiC-like family protein [Paenibacillus solani]|uniref:YwiC-like family protein n=1 Tax=Paenibacillus solani TaxID=1705565 RepID=UPI003D2AA596
MKKQGMVIPHEHGGWAMVSIPFVIGMLSGKPNGMHVFSFVAWLFLYWASYPFLQSFKKRADRPHDQVGDNLWGDRCSKFDSTAADIAAACLIRTLLLLLLMVNIWNVRRKKERAVFNDLCAILIFSLGGAAAYLLGGGWDRMMVLIILYNVLYFMPYMPEKSYGR